MNNFKMDKILIHTFLLFVLSTGSVGFSQSAKHKIPPDTPDRIKKLIERLNSRSAVDRANVAAEIGHIGSEVAAAIPFLIDMYNDSTRLMESRGSRSSFTSPRGQAIIALSKMGTQAVPALVESLKDKTNPEKLKTFAADTLGRIGDPSSFQPLVKALKYRSPAVVQYAAQALGKLGDKRAVVPLIEAMKRLRKSNYGGIAYILGELGDPRAIEPLLESSLRADAIRAVAKILKDSGVQNTEFVELIIPELKNKSPNTRASAAEVLGILGDRRAIKPLIDSLTDKLESIREYSARSLETITGIKEFGQDQKKWIDWWNAQKKYAG